MSEKRAPYITCVKWADKLDRLLNSTFVIEDRKEDIEQMNRALFTILAAIVEQCDGKVVILEKYLVNRQRTVALNFKKDKTTGDLELTLYKESEQQP